MAVLVCLAERAGELVKKEELIQSVWQGAFVSDEVLTNAISELRKAFGDDRRHPRFIETIPKRGYRLIAPVVAEPIAEETSRRRPTVRALLAVSALLVVAGTASLIWNLRETPSAAERTRISMAVFPFTNHSGDPSLDWLRTAIPELLVTSLSQSPEVRVLETGEIVKALEDMGHRDDQSLPAEWITEIADSKPWIRWRSAATSRPETLCGSAYAWKSRRRAGR